MVKYITVILFACFVSCKEKQVTNGTLFPIDFANGELYLPHTFVKGDFSQIENQVSKEVLDEMRVFANWLALDLKKELFYDSKNHSDFIFVHSAPLTQVDKGVANLYYDLLEKRLKMNKEQFDRNYSFIEKKQYTKNGMIIIKVRVLIKTSYFEKYQTQYIITSKRKTLGVIVSSLNDVDYEDYINTIHLK